MAPTIRALTVATALGLMLQACAQAPEETQAPTPVDPADITLNLPEQPACDCTAVEPASLSFLERGYVSLAEGDHEAAMDYFNRYQRTESSRQAEWEADVGRAFIRSLPDSSFHDADEARKAWRDLREENWAAMELHEQTQLARQSLDSFLRAEQQRRELVARNKQLEEDLAKREEALKRLRELTLGRTGSGQ